MPTAPDCAGCNWTPNDCTIDLVLVARLSDPGTMTTGSSTPLTMINIESNVRAISNVVQVKSGQGVVMAGLIGMADSEQARKVPFLGDIPVVGVLFRSKSQTRQKTETLIFLEARVLDPEPEQAREQSYEHFRLSEGYVQGDLLDNPLEYGLYRAGFGAYLPPITRPEQLYWERFGRTLRKQATVFDDVFK
jgi:type II secretory pathway component GspD/PulD (secretin)